ncbi:hypothetical protein TKK_0009521 [Trichogramma kaykai]
MPKTTNQKNLTEDQILSMLEHVQQHQELYKKSLTSYKDSKHKARVWEKIAILIGGGADAESLKKEWNSLKGKFTRYINHIKKIPSGSGLDKNIRPPPYYENLLFLKDNSLDNQILSSLDSDFEEQFCNRSRALPQKKSHDQESTTSASLTSPKDQSLEMATLTKEEEEDMTFFRKPCSPPVRSHRKKIKKEYPSTRDSEKTKYDGNDSDVEYLGHVEVTKKLIKEEKKIENAGHPKVQNNQGSKVQTSPPTSDVVEAFFASILQKLSTFNESNLPVSATVPSQKTLPQNQVVPPPTKKNPRRGQNQLKKSKKREIKETPNSTTDNMELTLQSNEDKENKENMHQLNEKDSISAKKPSKLPGTIMDRLNEESEQSEDETDENDESPQQ